MACPLRHYLGYAYWFAALVGAIIAFCGVGIKDARSFFSRGKMQRKRRGCEGDLRISVCMCLY